MSNPFRILSHRNLLPLNHSFKFSNNSFQTESQMLHKSQFGGCVTLDQLNEDSVTKYLINRPEFVETFLLKFYSKIQLIEILNKMVNDSSDIVYVPKRSDIFSYSHSKNLDQRKQSFENTQPIKVMPKESHDSMIQNSENMNYQWKVKDNIVRMPSMQSDNQPLSSKESDSKELTLTEIRKINENISKSPHSYEEILYKNLPKLSQKYLLSEMESTESEYVLDNKRNTLELIHEMKTDLMSILNCDGANVYIIDKARQEIHRNDLVNTIISTEKIEKGTTLAAYVAHENVGINCEDVFMDDRFPLGILLCNSFIKAAVAQPIILNTGETAGILELYRTANKFPYSKKEEEIFQNYCTWAALAIYYNEINLDNQKQQKLNKFILNVTQKMFGKFKNVDSIIKEIMASAKSLVKADRVSLFLLDKDCKELYAKIFDKGSYSTCLFETKSAVIRFKVGEGIAGKVAATGRTLNIRDAYEDDRFNRNIDVLTGYVTKTILCMPVKLKKEIIGVVQMLNKKNGEFTRVDENDFETFATYCGLALHISKMYEKILRSQQKYKVAIDVLSYHNGFSPEEFEKLKFTTVPGFIKNLDKLSFWPWTVTYDHQPMYVLYMFKDLFGLELNESRKPLDVDSYIDFDDRFDGEILMRFVLTVKKNYRKVPYHNWNHAFSVAHAMYALLKTCTHRFTLYEALAMFIGCLCHDLDHRGKTNQFMMQTSGPLSSLYSTSTMEHHHFNMTITILQKDGHNIFSHLSPQNYKKVLSHIKHCIIATDLTKYFEYRQVLESTPNYTNNKINSNRLLHMALSMTFCDLCSMYKSWDMQLTLVMIIMREFWTQGDEEKLIGQMPIRMMDRNYKLELPESQVGFLNMVCLPCYKLLSKIMPEAEVIIDEAQNNLNQWTFLANLPELEKGKKLQELEEYVEHVITENHLYVR